MLCLAAMEAPLILDINGQGKYGDKALSKRVTGECARVDQAWGKNACAIYVIYRHICYVYMG